MKNKRAIIINFILFLIGLIAVFFVCLHLGQLSVELETDNFIVLLGAIQERIQTRPFDVLPFNFSQMPLLISLYLAIILLIYINSNNNLKADMPGKEHGTAKWNDDLADYDKKFVSPKKKDKPDMNIILSDNVKLSLERIKLDKSKKVLNLEQQIAEQDQKMRDFQNQILVLPENESVNLRKELDKELILNQKLVSKLKRVSMNDRNANVLVLGGSGAGKTRYMIKPNILQANCSLIITDPKGEILEDMGDFLRMKGYKIKVFNTKNTKYSDAYNPFAYLNEPADVLILVDALIANMKGDGKSGGDPFWEKAERSILLSICFYLTYECKPSERTWAQVYRLLGFCIPEEGADQSKYGFLMEDLKKNSTLKDGHPAVVQYASFKSAAASEKTASSIITTAMNDLALFTLDDIKLLTSSDSIDFRTVGDEKTALFCVMPDDKKSYNFLTAILYTQMFSYLYNHADNDCPGKRLPYHVRFLLDEFANIGQIPDFAEKISTMRSRNISCTIILQSKQQLEATYDKKAAIIMDNCDSTVFLGANGEDNPESTLNYISGKLGEATITTRSRNRDSKDNLSSGYSNIGRKLMTPAELLNMPGNDCIVIVRGVNPFKSKKYQLEKHPNFWMCKDAGGPIYLASEHFITNDRSKYALTHSHMQEIKPDGYRPVIVGQSQNDSNSVLSQARQVNKVESEQIIDTLDKMDSIKTIKLVSVSDPIKETAIPKEYQDKYKELLEKFEV